MKIRLSRDREDNVDNADTENTRLPVPDKDRRRGDLLQRNAAVNLEDIKERGEVNVKGKQRTTGVQQTVG